MIYRTLRVDTLCTRSGSSWSTSCSLVYTQKQTTTSDRDNQIKSSQIVILGHYIDLPKIPQPIYQQLCDSTTVETGQNSPKIGINWPYLGLGCERWANSENHLALRLVRQIDTADDFIAPNDDEFDLAPSDERANLNRQAKDRGRFGNVRLINETKSLPTTKVGHCLLEASPQGGIRDLGDKIIEEGPCVFLLSHRYRIKGHTLVMQLISAASRYPSRTSWPPPPRKRRISSKSFSPRTIPTSSSPMKSAVRVSKATWSTRITGSLPRWWGSRPVT